MKLTCSSPAGRRVLVPALATAEEPQHNPGLSVGSASAELLDTGMKPDLQNSLLMLLVCLSEYGVERVHLQRGAPVPGKGGSLPW